MKNVFKVFSGNYTLWKTSKLHIVYILNTTQKLLFLRTFSNNAGEQIFLINQYSGTSSKENLTQYAGQVTEPQGLGHPIHYPDSSIAKWDQETKFGSTKREKCLALPWRVSNHNIQCVSIFTILHVSQLRQATTSSWACQCRKHSPCRPRSSCHLVGREEEPLFAGFYYIQILCWVLWRGCLISFSPKLFLLYWLEVLGHRSSALSSATWLTGIELNC